MFYHKSIMNFHGRKGWIFGHTYEKLPSLTLHKCAKNISVLNRGMEGREAALK